MSPRARNTQNSGPSLFAAAGLDHDAPRPLADKLRPAQLSEVVGQDHLLGPDGALTRMLETRSLGSLVPGYDATRVDSGEVAAIKGSLRMRRVLERASHDAVPDGPTELRLLYRGTLLRLDDKQLDRIRSRALPRGISTSTYSRSCIKRVVVSRSVVSISWIAFSQTPQSFSAFCNTDTIAMLEWIASLPPFKIAAFPVLKHRPNASAVTFGRDS